MNAYLIDLCFVGVNVLMAWWEAFLIRKNKPIYHGVWAAVYYAIVGTICFITKNWWLIVTATLLREVCFDISLNLFRKLKIDYVSIGPKSIIDKLNHLLFKDSFWILKVNCFIVYLVMLILRARHIIS